jgi:hypothetical protein
LLHESASSTDVNRLLLPSSTSVTVSVNGSATFVYTSGRAIGSRWSLVSTT